MGIVSVDDLKKHSFADLVSYFRHRGQLPPHKALESINQKLQAIGLQLKDDEDF